MIYTSYFANWRKLNDAKIRMYSIALKPPKGVMQLISPVFTPTESLLNRMKTGAINEETYIKEFNEQLNQSDLFAPDGHLILEDEDFVPSLLDNAMKSLKTSEIMAIRKGYNGIALCCYEKPDKFCHRHLVADFLNKRFNEGIEEFL